MSHDRACAITLGYNACTCPTPVPSEADPGTGEPWHWADARLAALATPDAGDVEALAKVILAERLAARELPNSYMDDAELIAAMRPRAEFILASDWLASHDAATADRVRREVAEGIARKAERLRRENPMNGDGANYMLDKVQQVIGAPEAVADERRLLDAERAEAYERLEAENAARIAREAGR